MMLLLCLCRGKIEQTSNLADSFKVLCIGNSEIPEKRRKENDLCKYLMVKFQSFSFFLK